MFVSQLYELNKNIFIDAQARYGKSYINKSSYNMNLSGDISYAKTYMAVN